MTKKVVAKKTRNRYSAQFKEQALARAEKDGVAIAAKDLGLAESQLYSWRLKSKQAGQMTEEQRAILADHARLKREVARLEEEVTFLKKAAAYFAKQPK
ncbi:transposase [Tahibacter amnicola]|uniref:Transposase n=1 Tax=Tahibacter amnicola TaxID=2976241 RepID=A0ABY6BKC8_9GAMM|nr:transposase [Tahibacter amnicola]UXI70320.1 transposase [Tahibacter amnicola]